MSTDLNHLGITIHQLIHPVFTVNRSQDGMALSMAAARSADPASISR